MGLWSLLSRTSSSLFWWASGACCQDKFIPLLAGLWSLLSRTSSSHFWWASGACCQEPVHPSSGGPLESAVKNQFIPLLVSLWSLLSRTSSSPFWWASGAYCQDQFIPHLASLGGLLSGPVHPSSGGPLGPAVRTSSSLLW